MRTHPELISDDDEDVHSAIERVLTERLGDVGAKVHTGRSRNDQVATALRLWAKDAIGDARSAVGALVEALAERAEEHAATLAPGYTHLQRAQPITIGHWLCAHGFAFGRDLERLARGARVGGRVAARCGRAGDVDVRDRSDGRAVAARRSVRCSPTRSTPCPTATSSPTARTRARWRWCICRAWPRRSCCGRSSEFGFVKLPDRWATGSSMMPQKKNPDVAELARGSTGLAVGALTGLLVTLKALPLAYDRDLQTDKQHVREVFTVTAGAFRAMAGLLSGAEVRRVGVWRTRCPTRRCSRRTWPRISSAAGRRSARRTSRSRRRSGSGRRSRRRRALRARPCRHGPRTGGRASRPWGPRWPSCAGSRGRPDSATGSAPGSGRKSSSESAELLGSRGDADSRHGVETIARGGDHDDEAGS